MNENKEYHLTDQERITAVSWEAANRGTTYGVLIQQLAKFEIEEIYIRYRRFKEKTISKNIK